MNEFGEGIGRPGNLMRLIDGTPVSLTVSDTAVEMDRKTGFRKQSTINFTPRFSRAFSANTPIEVPVTKTKAEYFKVIGKAMRGQELPGVYVEPIKLDEFEELKKARGGAVHPDNLDQLPKGF